MGGQVTPLLPLTQLANWQSLNEATREQLAPTDHRPTSKPSLGLSSVAHVSRTIPMIHRLLSCSRCLLLSATEFCRALLRSHGKLIHLLAGRPPRMCWLSAVKLSL